MKYYSITSFQGQKLLRFPQRLSIEPILYQRFFPHEENRKRRYKLSVECGTLICCTSLLLSLHRFFKKL